MKPPFFVNYPPNTVTVTPAPSTNELASRSANPFNRTRFSSNGRKLIADIQGQPFQLNHVRRILSDTYPAGIDSTIDAAQVEGSDGSTAGHPAQ